MKIFRFFYRQIWWIYNSLFFAKLGAHSYFKHPICITKQYVYCGCYVRVGNNARIEGVHKYNDRFFFPKIILGDYVNIQQNIHLTCATQIKIGNNTAIAANVSITDIHHPYTDVSIPIEKTRYYFKIS